MSMCSCAAGFVSMTSIETAVWQHVPRAHRRHTFVKLVTELKSHDVDVPWISVFKPCPRDIFVLLIDAQGKISKGSL